MKTALAIVMLSQLLSVAFGEEKYREISNLEVQDIKIFIVIDDRVDELAKKQMVFRPFLLRDAYLSHGRIPVDALSKDALLNGVVFSERKNFSLVARIELVRNGGDSGIIPMTSTKDEVTSLAASIAKKYLRYSPPFSLSIDAPTVKAVTAEDINRVTLEPFNKRIVGYYSTLPLLIDKIPVIGGQFGVSFNASGVEDMYYCPIEADGDTGERVPAIEIDKGIQKCSASLFEKAELRDKLFTSEYHLEYIFTKDNRLQPIWKMSGLAETKGKLNGFFELSLDAIDGTLVSIKFGFP